MSIEELKRHSESLKAVSAGEVRTTIDKMVEDYGKTAEALKDCRGFEFEIPVNTHIEIIGNCVANDLHEIVEMLSDGGDKKIGAYLKDQLIDYMSQKLDNQRLAIMERVNAVKKAVDPEPEAF